MIKHEEKVLSVTILNGYDIVSNWRQPMCVILTNEGIYADFNETYEEWNALKGETITFKSDHLRNCLIKNMRFASLKDVLDDTIAKGE